MPDIRDSLNRSHNGPEIISAHSRINLAEILSSPVAEVFYNLFRWVKTTLVEIGRKQSFCNFQEYYINKQTPYPKLKVFRGLFRAK